MNYCDGRLSRQKAEKKSRRQKSSSSPALWLSFSLSPSRHVCSSLLVYKYLISPSSHHVVHRYFQPSIDSSPSITQRISVSGLGELCHSQLEHYIRTFPFIFIDTSMSATVAEFYSMCLNVCMSVCWSYFCGTLCHEEDTLHRFLYPPSPFLVLLLFSFSPSTSLLPISFSIIHFLLSLSLCVSAISSLSLCLSLSLYVSVCHFIIVPNRHT